MGIKFQLQKRAEKLDRNASGSKGWHSTFYQSYFDGYTEYYVTKPDGGRKLTRVYTGTYYSQALSIRARVLIRLLYIALFALAVAAFLFGANVAGSAWYVVVCVAATIPFSFLTLLSLFHYLISPREMTQYEFSRATNIKKYSAAAACFLYGSAAATLVSDLQSTPIHISWSSLLLLIAGALCMTGISVIERQIQYNKRLSNYTAPPGGIEMGAPSTD